MRLDKIGKHCIDNNCIWTELDNPLCNYKYTIVCMNMYKDKTMCNKRYCGNCRHMKDCRSKFI